MAAAGQAEVQARLDAAKKAELAGDFRAAEAEYVQALKLHEDWEIHQRLGLVRHLQNKFEEAIPAFAQAIRLNPAAWGAQLFLGIDYYRTNRFPEALTVLERVDKQKAGGAETRFWLGATYLALKRYLEGQEILEELSLQQPENLDVLRMLAQSYSDYAVELHNRITREHPDSAWAYRVHGEALANEGHCEAAISEYRKAQALEPGMKGLREAMTRCEKRR
jgi:tetratricopeptide (TPR) repeat protein